VVQNVDIVNNKETANINVKNNVSQKTVIGDVVGHLKPQKNFTVSQLHWLPVRQRFAFKIAGLVHQSLAGAAPAYLADDCHLLSDAGRRTLRSHSSDIRKLLVPRTHNKFGDRSFSAAGPRLWNPDCGGRDFPSIPSDDL